MNEIIDFERKGNVIRFCLGKNGKQWGDDWNDAPYEHNCELVYDEYVYKTEDIVVPFDIDIMEPADMVLNSEFTREDFMKRKIYALEFFHENESIGIIHFGDTIDIMENIINKIK